MKKKDRKNWPIVYIREIHVCKNGTKTWEPIPCDELTEDEKKIAKRCLQQ
jgi:hypothetical protein